MKIVVAMDSFKGCLSSQEAGEAVRRGILRAVPAAETMVLPLADGGEGTAQALSQALQGESVRLTVTGPLGEPVSAGYFRAGSTAVMEMAQAAGLPLVPVEKRNPMHTTSRGVGELIAHAAEHGCRDFIIGIGGSATNDGGMGMLSALGLRFLDRDGRVLPGCGGDLGRVSSIDDKGLLPVLRDCRFRIACDVDNPLCGPRGASAVYGPQKGLTPEGVLLMDKAMSHYAHITANYSNINYVNYKGAGAAGGLGFAFLSWLDGELLRGAELVMDATGLREALRGADFIITGEGRMDAQTAMGKAPAAAAVLAREEGCVVLGLCGSVSGSRSVPGMDCVFPIQPGPVSLEEAMDPAVAAANLADTAQQLFSLISHIQKSSHA